MNYSIWSFFLAVQITSAYHAEFYIVPYKLGNISLKDLQCRVFILSIATHQYTIGASPSNHEKRISHYTDDNIGIGYLLFQSLCTRLKKHQQIFSMKDSEYHVSSYTGTKVTYYDFKNPDKPKLVFTSRRLPRGYTRTLMSTEAKNLPLRLSLSLSNGLKGNKKLAYLVERIIQLVIPYIMLPRQVFVKIVADFQVTKKHTDGIKSYENDQNSEFIQRY